MAGAMLEGWLAAGADPALITVIRPSGRPAPGGVRTLAAPPEDEVPAVLLLGMKPQKLAEAAPAAARAAAAETILVSILAGTELATLRGLIPEPRAAFRAMPNLPVALGKGVTNLFTDAAGAPARREVDAVMRPLGHVEWFTDEAQFALAGHLTAAAPAFLFRFVDALAEAAAELGVPADRAGPLAAAMAEGAGALASASGETPEELARRVASPGGTTEAGLAVLDAEDGIRSLMLRTLEASRRRGEELARAARPR
jgi:pyrroline-5-carboxylate reductase